MQTKEECLDFLEKARDSVDELAVITEREKQLQQDESRLEGELNAEKKIVADAVAATIKKRREELESSYDSEMSKAQEQLKKARVQREKAKNRGIKERIVEETSELHAHNKELTGRMKNTFREHHVPAFCKTKLYYSLYFPRGLKEYVTLLLFVLLAFFAVPCGIYFLIPDRKIFYLIGIYLLDIILVGGIYMTVGNHTKVQYMEALKEGRQILDLIAANQKKIRVITSTIKGDRNESFYNLEQYDDEIAKLNQELSDVAAKKKDALNTFETVTKNILQDEIEHSHQEKLDGLNTQYEDVKKQLQETLANAKEKRLYVTDTYEAYLGKDFLDSLKIKELMTEISEGRAANISEGIEKLRQKNQ